MFLARKLVLAHFWVAFVAFLGAIVLGEWQMFVRSPLSPWVNNPGFGFLHSQSASSS